MQNEEQRKDPPKRTRRFLEKTGVKCKAITNARQKCFAWVFCECENHKLNPCDEEYCERHLYFNDIPDNDVIEIINGTSKTYKPCCRCLWWTNDITSNCKGCLYKKQQKGLEKKKELPKCPLFSKTGQPCWYTPKEGNKCCDDHQYAENYTDTDLKSLKQCSGCKLYLALSQYIKGYKTCCECVKRTEKIRENKKEKKEDLPKCKTCNNISQDNGYCGKHQNNAKKEEVEKEGKKLCRNYIRGCKNILEKNYIKDTCEDCLIKDRAKDNTRHIDNKNHIVEYNNLVKQLEQNNTKNNIIGHNNETKYVINGKFIEKAIFDAKNINNVDNIDNNKSHETQKNTIEKTNKIINTVIKDDNSDYYSYESSLESLERKDNLSDCEFDDELNEELLDVMFACVNIDNESNSDYDDEFDNDSVDQHDYNSCVDDNIVSAIKIPETTYTSRGVNVISGTKGCSGCFKILKKENYIDNNKNEQLRCNNCREKERKRSKKNYSQKARDNIRLTKKKWKIKNWNKVCIYWRNYRLRQMIKLGDEYWIKNKKRAADWRLNNPEKMKLINEQKKANLDCRLKTYKTSAKTKNYDWILTDEYAKNLFTKPCHYCREFDEYEMCGIDRINSNLGYEENNVVSCCSVCNYMKNNIDCNIYYDKIRHILSYLHISGELYKKSYIFNNHCSGNINIYKNRASKINIPFELEQVYFNKLQTHNCYLCGKQTTNEHINGIDRIDSTEGYTENNCLSCCGDCNIMKNDIDIFTFILKIYKTYCNKHNVAKLDDENICAMIQGYLNYKFSQIKNDENDQLLSFNINRTTVKNQITKQNKIAKYGEEKYKKIKALKEQIRTNKNNIIKTEKLKEELNILLNDPMSKPKQKIKMTPEEKKEYERVRKQKQREALKEKYGDVEYNKMHAQKIKEQRDKKRNN